MLAHSINPLLLARTSVPHNVIRKTLLCSTRYVGSVVPKASLHSSPVSHSETFLQKISILKRNIGRSLVSLNLKNLLLASGAATIGIASMSDNSSSSQSTNADKFYEFFGTVKDDHLPIIYSHKYNISFFGLEKLHPFDSCKYQNIVKFLERLKVATTAQMIEPMNMPTEEHLKLVHTEEYLNSLYSSKNVAAITEVPVCAYMPNFLVRRRVLNPMLYATSGTILAAKVALERGFCINLSGGYHHAASNQGEGFCVYSDISLSLRHLRNNYPHIKKAMIIDLDAHQGNGHERDKLQSNDHNLFILDIYNKDVYPRDTEAMKAIDVNIPVSPSIDDDAYLKVVRRGLEESFSRFTPQIVYYNAGTDIMSRDPLGKMNIGMRHVLHRDMVVFEAARSRNIPIVMVLSGGYQKENAKVIAQSISSILYWFPQNGPPRDKESYIVQN